MKPSSFKAPGKPVLDGLRFSSLKPLLYRVSRLTWIPAQSNESLGIRFPQYRLERRNAIATRVWSAVVEPVAEQYVEAQGESSCDAVRSSPSYTWSDGHRGHNLDGA